MSFVKPVTRIALIAAAAGAIYFAATGIVGNRTPDPVEPGFANPAHVQLYKPKNENGNIEFFLNYEDGTEKISLPIKEGPIGPVVGDSAYMWGSMNAEEKSGLVKENWGSLELETRKDIIRSSLDRIIETYGE